MQEKADKIKQSLSFDKWKDEREQGLEEGEKESEEGELGEHGSRC